MQAATARHPSGRDLTVGPSRAFVGLKVAPSQESTIGSARTNAHDVYEDPAGRGSADAAGRVARTVW